MVKNKVLTPVLSGVLAVAVAGSGVGYYMLNKDGGKDGTLREQKINKVAENINETLDKTEKIIKGEMDFAGDCDVTVTFGSGFESMSGMSLQPIKMSTSAKQKGDNTEADVTLSYGDESVASLNAYYKRGEDDTAYVKIPELSDAYLSVDKNSLQEYFKEQSGVDFDSVVSSVEDIDFDVQAFVDSLDGYVDTAKGALPEAKDKGEKKGDIDGYEYSYTSETYDITGKDATNVVKAVLEKVKTDEQIKKLYEQGIEKAAELAQQSGTEMGEMPSFEDAVDEMIGELDFEDESDSSEAVEVTLYKDGDTIVGFQCAPEGAGNIEWVSVSTDDAEGIDFSADLDGASMTMSGVIKEENDALNGDIVMDIDAGEQASGQVTYSVKDLKADDNGMSGTIRVDGKLNTDSQDVSGWIEMKSDSTKDNINVDYTVGVNGEDFVTLSVTSKETEASDVTIPSDSETIYNALDEEQLNKYLEGCDVEGFQDHVKSVLGDELYSMMTSAGSLGTVDDYGYEDDYDYGDYDLGDYDFDEYDLDDYDLGEYDLGDYDFDVDDFRTETNDKDA